MRVLLIEVPGFHMNGEPVFQLGIAYLLAAVKKDGHEAKGVVFLREDHMIMSLPGWISGFKPDLVGISCNTFNRGRVKRAVSIIKSINSNVTIVLGGVHATYLFYQMLGPGKADFVVHGEGESIFSELCNVLNAGGVIEAVKGISYYTKTRIILNAERSTIENLDNIPQPDYSYAKELIESANMGWTITSRGCPVQCKFCSTGGYWGQKIRKHSPKRVVDDLEMIVSKYGVNRIFFHDDTFNLGIDRTMKICKEILDRGLKIRWGVSCRVHPVSPEMIEAMVEAGCSHIAFGVESGSPSIMEKMEKKITHDQIRYAFSLCEKHSRGGRLSTGCFMISGFPGETAQTVQETCDFLNTISLTDRPSCAVVYLLPGTKLWQGQTVLSDDFWEKTDEIPYVSRITGVDMETLNSWAKLIENSGKRIDFDISNHFWNGVILGSIPNPKCPTYDKRAL